MILILQPMIVVIPPYANPNHIVEILSDEDENPSECEGQLQIEARANGGNNIA